MAEKQNNLKQKIGTQQKVPEVKLTKSRSSFGSRVIKSSINNTTARRLKFKEQTIRLHELSEQDISRLIHELHSHQVKLKQTEKKLNKHREELMELVEERTHELQSVNERLENKIDEHKRAEEIIRTTNALLKLFLIKYSRKDYLESVVEIIRNWSGCRCVGIRVINEHGEIPYESYAGFDYAFWKSENLLSVKKDQCVCIRVITGQIEPQDMPAMTTAGSFRCDNTFRFVQELAENEKARFRGVCIQNGFASVAVVPIHFLDRTFAAIHFADEREGMVPHETIEALETITPLIGEAIHRFNMEDELMRNYESLQTTNELLENVFSNVHVLIAYMDTDFNFIKVNSKYAKNEGKEPEFYAGKNYFDLFSNEENKVIFRQVVETGEPYFAKAKPYAHTGHPEQRMTFRDWSLKPVKDADGKISGLVLSLIDVTDNITLYSELLRAEHLASVGRLAAGVAHEVNNPINGIINYAQILLNKFGKESKEYEIANRIIKEGDRIAGIVRSLLSFARESKDEKKPVHLSEILSDSLALTETLLKKDGIKLAINIDPSLPRINAQPQHIEQVFLNLISNACYGLNRKYPGAHNDKMIKIFAEAFTEDTTQYVRILFYDQGAGIPAEIKDKVIDPFFTTKSASEGTGLGLSISHGIISDHGGRIKIESIEGKFTNVIIDLPAQK